jgi:hypothetical protein
MIRIAAAGVRDEDTGMISEQLTLIQEGEFIVCDSISYAARPTPSLSATAALPINTMRALAVRLDNEIVPLPFVRSQDRRAVSRQIRIEGPLATRIAAALALMDSQKNSPSVGKPAAAADGGAPGESARPGTGTKMKDSEGE